MNIGFYGHSTASWSGHVDDVYSFVNTVLDYCDGTLVNLGVPQGSEERILFDLKKTKKLDLAIIFHSYPRYLFMPGCKRDIDIKKIKESRFDKLWESELENQFFDYGNIREKFNNNKQVFADTITNYKRYMHHKDLAENRFNGALVQIDQYLVFKKIPAIHVCCRGTIPSWFKFASGPDSKIATDIMHGSQEYSTYPNNLSKVGQQLMAKILIRLIDKQRLTLPK